VAIIEGIVFKAVLDRTAVSPRALTAKSLFRLVVMLGAMT
jgi:hypothetical protein